MVQKLIREENDLKKAKEKFESNIFSIKEVDEIVKNLFKSFPHKVEEYSSSTGLNINYLQHPRSEFDSLINFESKGSIYLKWERRVSNSLREAKLVFMLFDRPQSFNGRVPSKKFEPQLIKRLDFKPTINHESNIGWENEKFSYLLTNDLYNILFDLMLSRLE